MRLAGQMMERPLLVLPLLQYAAAHHADSAVVTRSLEGPIHRTTYGETYERVQRLAHALTRLGIKPGDRVATLALNTWRHLDLYFAVAGLGAVCHTINPRLPADQLIYLLSHAEDRLLFFDICFADQAAALVAGVPTLERAIALTDAAHAPTDAKFGDLLVYDSMIAREASTSRGRSSTRIPPPVFVIPRAPRVFPKGCSTAIALWCCTRSRSPRTALPGPTIF